MFCFNILDDLTATTRVKCKEEDGDSSEGVKKEIDEEQKEIDDVQIDEEQKEIDEEQKEIDEVQIDDEEHKEIDEDQIDEEQNHVEGALQDSNNCIARKKDKYYQVSRERSNTKLHQSCYQPPGSPNNCPASSHTHHDYPVFEASDDDNSAVDPNYCVSESESDSDTSDVYHPCTKRLLTKPVSSDEVHNSEVDSDVVSDGPIASEDDNGPPRTKQHVSESTSSDRIAISDSLPLATTVPDDSDHGMDENCIVRDLNFPAIFMRKCMKSTSSSKAQRKHKKNLRVYNNYHACSICERLVQHIPQHMKTHRKIQEVREIFKQEKPDFTTFRKIGDDVHNRKVIEAQKGEIILSRRPQDNILDVTLYGPCPHCREWVLLRNIKHHHKKCTSKQRKINNTPYLMSKRDLVVQSQVLAGHFSKHKPSKMMVNEVFKSMINDVIGTTAKGDHLILALGESWLRRSVDNVEKRRHYASQHMRLVARLLLQLRSPSDEKDPSGKPTDLVDKESANDPSREIIKKDADLWSFLTPEHFDQVAMASIKCSLPYMDDDEDLQSPSNAIKIKYDMKRMLNAKWAYIVKKNDHSEIEAKSCETFLRLIDVEWAEKVTKLARTVLLRRSFERKQELPSPSDIEKLTTYLTAQVKSIEKVPANYNRIVQLCQTRLMLYNKRRSGELEVVK